MISENAMVFVFLLPKNSGMDHANTVRTAPDWTTLVKSAPRVL